MFNNPTIYVLTLKKLNTIYRFSFISAFMRNFAYRIEAYYAVLFLRCRFNMVFRT